MPALGQMTAFRFCDEVREGEATVLKQHNLHQLAEAANLADELLQALSDFNPQAELSHGAILVELPASTIVDLKSILETATSELIFNANRKVPRRLTQAVSSPEILPFMRAATAAKAHSGLSIEFASECGTSLFDPPPRSAYTEPDSRPRSQLTSTFRLIGACNDEDGKHIVVIERRRFVSLPPEYDKYMPDLRNVVFGQRCWFEGSIEQEGTNSWVALPGGKFICQDAELLSNA